MAEYSIVIRPFELKPDISELTGDQVAKDVTMGLAALLQDVTKAMPGWEIIGHQLTRIDRHLVVSFLLRRGS
ncbi:hypothetical protein ES706_06586 [subsurface metagenome]